ncbi:TonB-dependent receptor [Hydrocarboniphaga sp.]|uniref:TonB-dependent receptor n=1 Tax=Hydrocarboniphaga sp. TaxID=2033016 RepID=UPI002622F1EE|nr:TonB-dependent receptor [Hydrocarboniphaga sp.]
MMLPGLSSAAETVAADTRSVADIQAEIDRLKQAVEANQRALAAKGAADAAPKEEAPVAAAPTADQPKQLKKVRVKAAKPLAALKDVPSSSSVVTGADLAAQAGADLGAITKRTANVSRNAGNSRTYSLSIRGLGKVTQTEAQDPSVGVVVDGVFYAFNPLGSFDFYDIDKVEVLRGPQGTQGGKTADMGDIIVTTRKPSFTPGADYSLAFGENKTIIATLGGGGPVIDDLLAWRGSLVVNKGDGDIKNRYNPDQTFYSTDRVAGRVSFLLRPSDSVNALVSVDSQPKGFENYNASTFYKPTPTQYSDGKPNTLTTDASTRLARSWFTQQGSYSYLGDYLRNGSVNVDAQLPLITYTNGASAQVNWTLGDYQLSSITAYRSYHFDARNDEGTPFDISVQGGGKDDKYQQTSQEFRVGSQVGKFVDYQAGLYLFRNTIGYGTELSSPTSGWGSDAGAWFATTAQYNRLDTDGNGRYLLTESLNGLAKNQPQSIKNVSEAVYASANWHLSDPLTLTTGVRITRENRTNTTSSFISDNGVAPELNPDVVNGVSLGGFTVDSTNQLVASNTAEQLAVANAAALKYFNVASYGDLSTAQKQQLADARAIRKGQIGVVWGPVSAQSIHKIQPSYVFSPSYKLNKNQTAYISYQHGEKAGIAQVINGTSQNAKPEKNNAYELGLKSALLNNTLLLNTDMFLNNITNYQQGVNVLDPYSTAAQGGITPVYVSATGNVPKVQVKGLELDGTYTGIPYTSIRFSAAYNDAVYKKFPNSAQPVEFDPALIATQPTRDVSGQQVAGSSKYTFNIGAEYRVPVFARKEFHTSFNTNYASHYNSDIALSSYAEIPNNSITDFAIGIGRADRTFDVNVVVKNLFDDRTPQSQTWNSLVPAVYQWYGIVFTGKLG